MEQYSEVCFFNGKAGIMKNLRKPPVLAKWLLGRLVDYQRKYSISGDLEEVYYEIYEEKGCFIAYMWFWHQTVLSFPKYFSNSIYWSAAMLKSYLKIAVRNLKKQKAFSLINISGLSIGLTCTVLILLFVQFEMSYDRFHKNADRIYRVDMKYKDRGRSITMSKLKPSKLHDITENYAEIENNTKIHHMRNILIGYGKNRFFERDLFFADPSLFEVFTFNFIKGNPESALETPNSILLSEKMVQKYFGKEDPIGKTVTFASGKTSNYYNFGTHSFTVTGILENFPENSTHKFDFISSLKSLKSVLSGNETSKYTYSMQIDGKTRKIETVSGRTIRHYITYLKLKEDSSPKDLQEKIQAEYDKSDDKIIKESDIHLQPLTGIHLLSKTRVKYIYIFSAIALIVLIIACINYMNLSTARFSSRAKEVGMKKIVGARRSQLIRQFLGESTFLTVIALLISLFLAEFILPYFNNIIGNELKTDYLNNWQYLAGLAGIILFTGLVAGSYPAFFLSSLKPVNVLKKQVKTSFVHYLLRKNMVVVQFTISIFLIISTIIITKQLNFMRNEDLGYNKENIVVLPIKDRKMRPKLAALKTELSKHSNIISASSSQYIPLKGIYYPRKIKFEGAPENKEFDINICGIDNNFINTYGLTLLAGREFEKTGGSNSGKFLLNELAVKELGNTDVIGKSLKVDENRHGEIIGIIKDFQLFSKKEENRPFAFYVYPGLDSYISLKINPDDISLTLEYINQVWNRFSPEKPPVYQFFDDIVEAEYTMEERLGKMFIYFSFLTVFIACLGLFGLASFTAERRTKEIGIRKTLGATVPGIVVLLTREFTKWVVVANVIAWPASWFVMNKWLQEFAYKADFGWDVYILSGFLAMVIALLTIGFQAVKAAAANPVNALKYE